MPQSTAFGDRKFVVVAPEVKDVSQISLEEIHAALVEREEYDKAMQILLDCEVAKMWGDPTTPAVILNMAIATKMYVCPDCAVKAATVMLLGKRALTKVDTAAKQALNKADG